MASIIAMIFAALRDRSVTSLNTKNDTRFTAVVIPPAITYLTISFSISFFYFVHIFIHISIPIPYMIFNSYIKYDVLMIVTYS